jgi:rhomboid protease GluP
MAVGREEADLYAGPKYRAVPGAQPGTIAFALEPAEPEPVVSGPESGVETPEQTLGQAQASQTRLQDFQRTLTELTPRVVITPTILAINVTVYIVMLASGVDIMKPTIDSLLNWGANFGPKTTSGEWWRLLTCTFVHIGIFHILLNMWVLWDAGNLVERLVGNVGFLLLYMISGVMGSLASLFWNPFVVSAGASGAVFGVYGALLGFLLRERGSIPREVLSRLRNSGLGFLAFNILFGMTQAWIDQAAHLGGLGAGFLCGLALSQPLTPDARGARLGRNILVTVGGVVAIVAGVFSLFSVNPNLATFQAELAKFDSVEKKALNTFNSAILRVQQNQLKDAELANIVEREVLPEWRAARERLAGIGSLPAKMQSRLTDLLEYMKLRQEGWELLVQAARENNLQKANAANAKQAAAEAIARRLSGKK